MGQVCGLAAHMWVAQEQLQAMLRNQKAVRELRAAGKPVPEHVASIDWRGHILACQQRIAAIGGMLTMAGAANDEPAGPELA